ncbi:FkbM family methyltransferase [Aureimonas flava]|uniref:FkbM family methyltransferase n=1 Tax=Aureimonas flava TaxID=2320271 RepID=A0A3A1WNC7_9HYPH|nr:FkbM family methyltransferase [Aureimonas flava]RIY02015.1 FkbM family methyltransferase [Aureimonas flava]
MKRGLLDRVGLDAATLGLWRSIAIYNGQPWRRWALDRFLRTLVRPGDLAFDIGAHVGSRSRALARAGARVVAFEPQPLFADYLARRLDPATIRLDRRAVGRAPGRAELAVSARHPTVSTLSGEWRGRVAGDEGFRGVEWGERVSVEVSTLDILIAEHGEPAFCKIDVEGHEAEVLAGLSRPLRCLAFEYTPATLDLAFRCLDRLGELGRYEFNLAVGEEARFRLDRWLGDEAFRARLALEAARNRRSGDVYARLVGPRA